MAMSEEGSLGGNTTSENELDKENYFFDCELCGWVGSRTAVAKWFCRDCAQYLCSRCGSLHRMQSSVCELDRMVKIAEMSSEADSRDVELKKQYSRGRTAAIRALTVLDDKLFVIRDHQSHIRVFDADCLKDLSVINIPDMKNPAGLVGCSHHKVLYISDWDLKCIHRVNITGESIQRWNMIENYQPYGLSMTLQRRNLLITSKINDKSRVVEYTSDGQPIRDIELEGSIERAWHTVQLGSDRLVVCYGWRGSSLHRVCVINDEGEIMKSYGREGGQGDGHLVEPRSLTTDCNNKLLFVADYGNHRVLMFDFDLTYLGQVHTPCNLRFPTRLYFDSSTDRLFVGEETGRVLIVNPEFFPAV